MHRAILADVQIEDRLVKMVELAKNSERISCFFDRCNFCAIFEWFFFKILVNEIHEDNTFGSADLDNLSCRWYQVCLFMYFAVIHTQMYQCIVFILYFCCALSLNTASCLVGKELSLDFTTDLRIIHSGRSLMCNILYVRSYMYTLFIHVWVTSRRLPTPAIPIRVMAKPHKFTRNNEVNDSNQHGSNYSEQSLYRFVGIG